MCECVCVCECGCMCVMCECVVPKAALMDAPSLMSPNDYFWHVI